MTARALVCCALTAVLAAPALARAQAPPASLPDIEDEVMCPICGTTLELSEAPQAERERELIRRQIAKGKTKDEIKDALVVEYGTEVLATPDGSGFDLIAWFVPILGLLIAAGAIALAIARKPRTPEAIEPIDPSDETRLERDLSSFDP